MDEIECVKQKRIRVASDQDELQLQSVTNKPAEYQEIKTAGLCSQVQSDNSPVSECDRTELTQTRGSQEAPSQTRGS